MRTIKNKGNNRLTAAVCAAGLFLALGFAGGCGGGAQQDSGANAAQEVKEGDVLMLAAYTVPREAYQNNIIPAFQRYWKQKTGRTVAFRETYNASGAQARAMAAGLEADVAALSLENDIQFLVDAGLIRPDWKKGEHKGFVTRSVVVMAYRPGSNKRITRWEDLTEGNIDLIYPSPKTSGGAMWVVNAIYGAGLKISEQRTGNRDPLFARELLKKIQARVKVMDKSGRASVTTFENGFGDVLLTYENEALLRQKQGKPFPFIIPAETILIENPAAVVDRNVDKHGTREVAEAFLEFLYTEESQRHFARNGFRPVNRKVLDEFRDVFPEPPLLFDIHYLGGWDTVAEEIYGPRGTWTEIVGELAGRQ